MNAFKALLAALSPFLVTGFIFLMVYIEPMSIGVIMLVILTFIFIGMGVGIYKDVKRTLDAKER